MIKKTAMVAVPLFVFSGCCIIPAQATLFTREGTGTMGVTMVVVRCWGYTHIRIITICHTVIITICIIMAASMAMAIIDTEEIDITAVDTTTEGIMAAGMVMEER